MAGSMSDYLETHVIDHCIGRTSFTMPAAIYIALCTTIPTDASTGTTIVEANYTTYARFAVSPVSTYFGAASSPGGTSANIAAITFAAVTAGSSVIVGIAICDALTLGNMLYWSDVTSKTVDTSNTPPTIAIGALTITQS